MVLLLAELEAAAVVELTETHLLLEPEEAAAVVVDEQA
jgi:hypothetical protein